MPLPKYNGLLMHTTRVRGGISRRVLKIATVLLAAVATNATAQRATGPWEDGSIAPRGVLRIGINPRFANWNERYSRDNGTREPLGADFTRDSLGPAPAFLPYVALLAPALTTLTGLASPPLSLGMLQTRLNVTEVQTHITIDYGLNSRLGLQALVPYVKNRVYVSAIPNQGDVGATLGFNPSRSFPGARQQNDLVVSTLGTATSTLSSELVRCQGISDPSCAAINADRAGATALVQQATQVSGALATVYGTSAFAGALYAPVAGGALHTAVDARLTAINAQFRNFLGAPPSGEWVNGRPVAASLMAASDFDRLLNGEESGISARAMADYEHSHVGDIELGAKFILLDTFGSPGATLPPPHAGAIRVAAAGIYRLGTGQLDLPHDFTDVGTGDRQADIEVRGFGDLALSTKFWVSAIARFALQQPDQLVRRITDQPGDPFPELVREQEVDRDLGDVIEFEVAPRFVPNDEFSLSALYRYRHKGVDTYDGSFLVNSADGTAISLDASTLGLGTEQTDQMFGFAITFSTVRAYARNAGRWPIEISFMHTQTLSGKGVPRQSMNGFALRLYRPIRGNVLKPAK